ncbi:putative Ras-related protein Rab-5B [Hypsibius exemplaris]|uniref:Ras-related protein Rab-5B n=1 Tax=Hypsibius exemplaris TaxID=2072580 RepID=A0A1W0W9G1_HYPEX|nr:putative Ras-related protein Rab-5B [Hypsibius exemplaris]
MQSYKVVVLGDGTVGKTSISLRFVRDTFNHEHIQTIGAAYMTQTIVLGGSATKLEIWDTAGQEIYHNIVPLYYRNARAALIVYDVTNRGSFGKASFWLNKIKEEVLGPLVLILVGNKIDLTTSRRVTTEEGEALAQSFGIPFMEVSAKASTNVTELFVKVAQLLKAGPVGSAAVTRGTVKAGDSSVTRNKTCCGYLYLVL